MSNATPTRSHRPAAGRRHTAQPPMLLNRILQGLEAVESSGLDLRDQSRDPNRERCFPLVPPSVCILSQILSYLIAQFHP